MGKPTSGMRVRSGLPGWSSSRIHRVLAGLPVANGYTVVVTPVWFPESPYISAYCDFDLKRIELMIPEPFKPFTYKVRYRAKRLRGPKPRFRWYAKKIRFNSRRELIRFLYCHEYFHLYLWEVRQGNSVAETACDRYALENFRRRTRITPPGEIDVRVRPKKIDAA